MSFLQPWMLWGLPLIALPVIIHLINQRRYQTVPWAAMAFLLTANKMSSGYAKIRRYLILAARTLAVAGLVFAVARPLSSGWLGLAVGSRVDTTIIIVDRSPSMAAAASDGQTNLASLTRQLMESLRVVESNRYVWIDDDANRPVLLESVDQLAALSVAQPSAATADIASMVETAVGYIRDNQPSSVECWIVSDLQRGDWNVASGRWSAINQSIRRLPQSVRLHLVTPAETSNLNRSIRVTQAKRVDGQTAAEAARAAEPVFASSEEVTAEDLQPSDPPAGGTRLLVSLVVRQIGEIDETADPDGEIPIELDLDGARSKFDVKLTGDVTEIANLVIPLDGGSQSGWGRVSLPADANLQDNEFYFAYGAPTVRKTVVVCGDAVDGRTDEARPLMLAAGIPPDAETVCLATAVTAEEFVSTELNDVAMVLWTERLPDETETAALQPFLERGGRLLFFAPEETSSRSFAGLTWGDEVIADQPVGVSTWIGDHDLLSGVRSGAALPVGDLKVSRYRRLEGSKLSLATLPDESPLLARSIQGGRSVYFLATGVDADASSLARSGIVLYALIQRALADGVGTLGSTRQLTAGETSVLSDDWVRKAGPDEGTSTHFARYSGVYGEGERLIAVNRGDAEDTIETATGDQLEGIFAGLNFDRVQQQAGSSASLVQEIWRLFLGLMMIALVAEALLCLPRKRAPVDASNSPFPARSGGGVADA